MTGVSIAHDPVLAPDRFAAIVTAAAIGRVVFTSAAVDAFGVIRLRSLMERHGLTVSAVVASPRCPEARRSLLGHILAADAGTELPPLLAVSGTMLAAPGGGLASIAAKAPSGTLLQLEPAAWHHLALDAHT